MTVEQTISHCQRSIEDAIRGRSRLDPECLKITGFSTPTQRHLMNNLCAPFKNYLECGLYAGASFCSALSGNPDLFGWGFEDKSQPFHKEGIFEELSRNLERFAKDQHSIFYRDCFDPILLFRYVDKMIVPLQADVLNYDAHHDFEFQAKALPHFIDDMNNPFVFIVDDYSWPSVAGGTDFGFEKLKDRIRIEQHWHLGNGQQDHPVWHNDTGIWVISKV